MYTCFMKISHAIMIVGGLFTEILVLIVSNAEHKLGICSTRFDILSINVTHNAFIITIDSGHY